MPGGTHAPHQPKQEWVSSSIQFERTSPKPNSNRLHFGGTRQGLAMAWPTRIKDAGGIRTQFHLGKSYTITAEVEAQQGGGEGMIVTNGGRLGGFGFYLLKGKPVFLYNYSIWLVTAGRAKTRSRRAGTIVFDFTYDGPGPGKGGTGVLKVDDKEVANQKAPNTIPFLMTLDETLDVGIDTRASVNDNDFKCRFVSPAS